MLGHGRSANRLPETQGEEDPQSITSLVEELIDDLEKAYQDLLFEADRDELLLHGLAKREQDIDTLKRENQRLKQELARIKSKPGSSNSEVLELRAELEKLRKTKGYRLQRKFWQLRKSIVER